MFQAPVLTKKRVRLAYAVAITADANAFQQEMNAIWDHLLPAFGASALPENAAAQEKLKLKAANLVAHPAKK